MESLSITTTEDNKTVDGLMYRLERNKIAYRFCEKYFCLDSDITFFEVKLKHLKTGDISSNFYYKKRGREDLTTHQGRQMPKFLKEVVEMMKHQSYQESNAVIN